MLIIPPVTFAIIFVLVSTACNGNPAPGLLELKENTNSSAPSHITGGGRNKVGGPNINSGVENTPASRLPKFNKEIQGTTNSNHKRKAKVPNETKNTDMKASSSKRNNKSSGNLRKLLRILANNRNTLNETQFIGRMPTLPPRAHVSASLTCPNGSADSWWPGQEGNLQSTFPWVYKDLGKKAYPRYVCEASCARSTGRTCLDIKQTFPYFIIQERYKGLALMKQVKKAITVGCYCKDAMTTPKVTEAPTPRVTPTDYRRRLLPRKRTKTCCSHKRT